MIFIKKFFIASIRTLIPFVLSVSIYAEQCNGSAFNVNVKAEPFRDLGFFTLALLDINYSQVQYFGRRFEDEIIKAKEAATKNNIRNLGDYKALSASMKQNTSLQNLAYIPFIFNNYNDTETAFLIILGKKPETQEELKIVNLLNNVFFAEYQNLSNLQGQDKTTAGDFFTFMKVIYQDYYLNNFDLKNSSVQKSINSFKKSWMKIIEPAISAVNYENSVKNLNITLINIIPKFNFIIESLTDVNDLITLLPIEKQELEESLWFSYYQVCYNISEDYLAKNNSLKPENSRDTYFILLKNITVQLMYEGLYATDQEMLGNFFKSNYIQIEELKKDNLLEQSIELAGYKFTQKEFSDLKNSLIKQPEKTIRLIYKNGYLIPPDLLKKIRSRIQDKLLLNVDTSAAMAMYNVIAAIHEGKKFKEINNLIDKAFKFEAYRQAGFDYSKSVTDKNNLVTLGEFKKFLISLSENEITPSENANLQTVASEYVNAVSNPSKYLVAIEQYKAFPMSFYEKVVKEVERWIPVKMEGEKINIWLLFDMQPTMETYRNNIYINICTCIDENGNVNEEMYYRALCYIVAKLAFNRLEESSKNLNYEDLPDNSKLKMVKFFIDKFMRVGAAAKICFNSPGLISGKIKKDLPSFWINSDAEKEWIFFETHSIEVFSNARDSLNNILNGKYKTLDDFIDQYEKYWEYYQGGIISNKVFDVGYRFYLGSEITGMIYEVFGKDGLEEVLKDYLKVIPMFNEALLKVKPLNYEKYLFPKEIIDKLNYEYLTAEPEINFSENDDNKEQIQNVQNSTAAGTVNVLNQTSDESLPQNNSNATPEKNIGTI